MAYAVHKTQRYGWIVLDHLSEIGGARGRMIDAILPNTVLPRISEEYMTRMVEGRPLGPLALGVTDGDFSFDFA